MTVTLAHGQLFTQTSVPERIWRLGDEENDRWSVIVHHSPPGDQWSMGSIATVGLEWLQEECQDWREPPIDPPQGDGVQWVTIVDADGLPVESVQFTRAQDAVGWIRGWLATSDGDETAQWWAGDEVTDTPDLTCRFDGTVLVWS